MAEEGHGAEGLLHKKVLGLPLPVVIGGGALVAWFVLAHRPAGGAVAPAAAGPQGLSGDMGQGTAQQLQQQLQQDQGGYDHAVGQLYTQAQGVIRGVWQQVEGGWVNTGSKNAGQRGRFLPEAEALKLGPKDKGPYATPSHALTLGNAFKLIGNNLSQAVRLYAGSQGVPLGGGGGNGNVAVPNTGGGFTVIPGSHAPAPATTELVRRRHMQ